MPKWSAQGKSKYVPILSSIVDVILLVLAFVVAKHYVFEGVHPNALFYRLLGVGSVLLWVIIAVRMNLYELPRILFIHKILSKNVSVNITSKFNNSISNT